MKILVILVAAIGCLYNILLNFVVLRSANNPIPSNVKDVYDEQTYLKWKQYLEEHCKNKIIFDLISGIITIVLLIFNVHSFFSNLIPSSSSPMNVIIQLMVVVGLEVIIGFLIDIPKNYVATMKIEEKYGFNRSTKKTFVTDQIRSLIISLLLSFFLAIVIAFCHIWFGNLMAIVCAGVLIIFILIISFISPFLGRIGNKFAPLEDGELRDKLTKLLESHNYQVRAIEVMDASRRTTNLNAYFVGFGKLKTIVLYDNLVNVMSPDEICAVFAHELGHGLHKDTLKLQIFNMLNFVLIALAAWALTYFSELYKAFGFENINYGFTFIILGMALSIIQPFTSLITNALSRKFEFAADKQAVQEGYGEAIIPALKKLAKDNFAHLSPSPLYVLLEYSHPPIDKRIAAIEQEMANMNK